MASGGACERLPWLKTTGGEGVSAHAGTRTHQTQRPSTAGASTCTFPSRLHLGSWTLIAGERKNLCPWGKTFINARCVTCEALVTPPDPDNCEV